MASSTLLALSVGYVPCYGTAGFRTEAHLLDAVLQRCGVLMAIKSAKDNKGTGIVITASHNPEKDNGVKLIDHTGEMIDPEWEIYANELAISHDPQQVIAKLVKQFQLTHTDLQKAHVVIGYDTRPSSKHLYECCVSGVRTLGAVVVDKGLVTTPELQYYIQAYNTSSNLTFVEFLATSFKDLLLTLTQASTLTSSQDQDVLRVCVDCANGVGSIKLRQLATALESTGISLELFNTGEGMLNHECGADYVEKTRNFPINTPQTALKSGVHFSIDGDADRIVGFINIDGKLKLVSGDKFSVLFAHFINQHIDKSHDIKCAIVQTAYANGASTHYVRNNLEGFEIVCTSTGVRHLHHAAKQYDVGIYFESNGHGTVLINKNLHNQSNVLKHLGNVLSQVTGDALGNLLAVLCILKTGSVNVNEWINMYHDMPCLQTPIHANRALFKTTDADRVCVTPYGLQDTINHLVASVSGGRAFVRPSGTEDCVRIYVEAYEMPNVLKLTNAIKNVIVN